jgi:hypothetical protein
MHAIVNASYSTNDHVRTIKRPYRSDRGPHINCPTATFTFATRWDKGGEVVRRSACEVKNHEYTSGHIA